MLVKAIFKVKEFISGLADEDLRYLVVGGRVIGAITRSATDGAFRANVHSGGAFTATK